MEEETFIDPVTLSINQLTPKRPVVGDNVPVVLWRLIRLVGMHNILKEETSTITYLLGKQIGKMLDVKSVDDLKNELIALKIGLIDIRLNTATSVHISIGECLTCAGITPPLGRPICQLEVGIVAGALEKIYPGKKVSGIETECIGGLGDVVCLAECTIV
jgi:predicted hydrocarbon binding protein